MIALFPVEIMNNNYYYWALIAMQGLKSLTSLRYIFSSVYIFILYIIILHGFISNIWYRNLCMPSDTRLSNVTPITICFCRKLNLKFMQLKALVRHMQNGPQLPLLGIECFQRYRDIPYLSWCSHFHENYKSLTTVCIFFLKKIL